MRKTKYHSSVLFSSIIAFPLVSHDQISDVLEYSHFRVRHRLTGLLENESLLLFPNINRFSSVKR